MLTFSDSVFDEDNVIAFFIGTGVGLLFMCCICKCCCK